MTSANFVRGTCTKQMMPCDQRNKRRLDPISPSELPLDSIVEILSWLPVESLLRFKCVCKQWCSLIQDYQFVLKHVDRTNPMSLFYPCKSDADENFEFVSSSTGFCMEKSVSNSRVFRIRNPATHQVLHLPDAPPHTRTVDFAIHSLTGECKVLCVYWEKIRKNIDSKFGFKVITVGIDEQWRPVELPDQNKLRNKSVLRGCTTAVDKVEGVCHLLQTVRITDDEEECYMEVQSFDLWSESFTTNTVPQGVFSDFSQVGFVIWHNCLSICHTKENAFNLLVLEDYKKHKWCKNKIIIPLRLSNELRARCLKNRNLNRTVVYPEELELHISGVNYNMTYVGKPKNSKGQCISGTGEILHKSSLMILKGMIPEKGYNAKKEGK